MLAVKAKTGKVYDGIAMMRLCSMIWSMCGATHTAIDMKARVEEAVQVTKAIAPSLTSRGCSVMHVCAAEGALNLGKETSV